MTDQHGVWVFNGEPARFSSGVFSTLEKGRAWVEANKLTGILTWYPLDIGAYDWAASQGWLAYRPEHNQSPAYVGSFSNAGQSHFHFRHGKDDDGSEGD
jgi:hypothetical protein